MTNFKYPYFSRNIGEFWRRWYVSLSTWFRDYLYIPLGGSRVSRLKNLRKCVYYFFSFQDFGTVQIGPLSFGDFFTLFYLYLLFITNNRKFTEDIKLNRFNLPSLSDFFRILTTFTLVSFLLDFFFRADTLDNAILFINKILTFLIFLLFYF